MLRVGALAHDLGRVAVSAAVWDKPGPLNDSEWEKVRLHPYHSERLLARAPALATATASADHTMSAATAPGITAAPARRTSRRPAAWWRPPMCMWQCGNRGPSARPIPRTRPGPSCAS